MLKQAKILMVMSVVVTFVPARAFADAIADVLTVTDLTGSYHSTGTLTASEQSNPLTNTITLDIPSMSFVGVSGTESVTLSAFTVSLTAYPVSIPAVQDVSLPIFAGFGSDCFGINTVACLSVDSFPTQLLSQADVSTGVTSVSVDVPAYSDVLAPFANGGMGRALLSISPITVTLTASSANSPAFTDTLTVAAIAAPEPSMLVPLACIGLLAGVLRLRRGKKNL